jgi:hypothetical protein
MHRETKSMRRGSAGPRQESRTIDRCAQNQNVLCILWPYPPVADRQGAAAMFEFAAVSDESGAR